MKKYITTPIYYANGAPHIGHAYTTVLADVLKKIALMQGNEAFLSTGLDEHGQKNQHACEKAGVDIATYLDSISVQFESLFHRLDIDYDYYVRTTASEHKTVVKRLLQMLFDKGLIIKKQYEGLYCEGCELFIKQTDLDETGCCPIHKKPPKKVVEENYFFPLEPHRAWLKDYIATHPDWIGPSQYTAEVLGMLEKPLDDLCISRPKERVWLGIDLPFDDKFVTYIWFDALINYISTLRWGENDHFNDYWAHSYHLIGKDILKPHCIYWPIMLHAAGLDPQTHCIVHGFWTAEGGVKMGKSLGNVVDPNAVIDLIGAQAFRFYLISTMSVSADAPISMNLVRQGYKNLANNLGNLQMRVIKMVQKSLNGQIPVPSSLTEADKAFLRQIADDFAALYRGDISLELSVNLGAKIMAVCTAINGYFAENEPWVLAKDDTKRLRFEQVIYTTLDALRLVATAVYPIMPQISTQILMSLGYGETPVKAHFVPEELKAQNVVVSAALFPPLEDEKPQK